MSQIRYNFYFFYKICCSLLYLLFLYILTILFNCYFLSQPYSLIYFTKCTFTYLLYKLYLFIINKEVSTNTYFLYYLLLLFLLFLILLFQSTILFSFPSFFLLHNIIIWCTFVFISTTFTLTFFIWWWKCATLHNPI